MKKHPDPIPATRHGSLWNAGRRLYIHWRIFLRSLQIDRVQDPYRLIYIDPCALRWICRGVKQLTGVEFRYSIGMIFDGDADVAYNKPIHVRPTISATVAHFQDGLSWEETDYYKGYERKIKDDVPGRRFKDLDALRERLRGIETLYRRISTEGYKSQRELGSHDYWHEICVCIDRHGEVMFYDGGHRIALAMLLRLKRVPVLVLARHRRWHDFTISLRRYVSDGGGRSCFPVPHPDLEDIPSEWDSNWLKKAIEDVPFREGSSLDADAEFGFNAGQLEAMGFRSKAWTLDNQEREFLVRLRRAAGRSFEISEGSLLDAAGKGPCSLVLGGRVFQRMWSDSAAREMLAEALRQLKPEYLLAEPPPCDGDQGKEKVKEFSLFIAEHAGVREKKHPADRGNGPGMLCFQ